jgi:hypothetical protein
MVQEDHGGPMLKDSCYKCGETGQVSEAELRSFKIGGLVSRIAAVLTRQAEQDAKANPEGEDWTFAAAESGCSLEEYRYNRMSWYEMEASTRLKEMEEKSPQVLDALLMLTDGDPLATLSLVAPEAQHQAREEAQEGFEEPYRTDEQFLQPSADPVVPEDGLPF